MAIPGGQNSELLFIFFKKGRIEQGYSDGEKNQEREAESGGNSFKWKSKSFVIAGVKLVLEKFFS